MKPYCSLFVFIVFSVAGFSQSNSRLTNVQNFNPGDRLHLGQFLWGYSKNSSGKSEKLLIDFNAIENWRGLGEYLAVSNDGKYFAYTINKPTGTRYWFRRLDSLVIQSTRNGWQLAFAGSNPGFFTAKGDKYIFKNGESLCFLQLGKSQPRVVKDVVSYKTSNKWLAYQLKSGVSNFLLHNLVTGKETAFNGVNDYNFDNSGDWLVCKRANDLLLYNLVTGTEKHIPFVVDYAFASNGKAVLLNAIEKKANGVTTTLKYVGAPDWQEKIIWSTNKEKTSISSYSLDNSGRQVVFSVQDNTGTHIWYFNAEIDKATLKFTNDTAGIGEGLVINGNVSFTDNGHYIKFLVQSSESDSRIPDPEMAQVEVWNHKDLYLQSAQAELSKEPKIYASFINIENGKVMPLESNDRKLYLLQGDFAVVKKYSQEGHGDRFWEVGNGYNKDSNWIVSLKDGSSQVLPTSAGSGNFWFSPGGRYLLYFDLDKGCHYFSYDLHTGILKDITVNVPENQLGFLDPYSGKLESGNLAAWIENENAVLVYDNYDIWRLDLTGKQSGINITDGFGHSNNTMLNLPTTDHYSYDIPVIKANAPLLLRAFNTRNKQSGFYRKADLNARAPKLVYMGDHFMKSVDGYHDPNLSNSGMAPVKAKDRESWIVQRQSSTDAPNYYETNDFKSYKRLTNFQPQQTFKWLTEELHSFKHLDGREGQGILYKPDDFDSTKKYPVFIALYGTFSNNLNQFHIPTYIDQDMAPGKSPIWFVNNGYLVFTPDMYTTPLKPGPSTVNVMEGAAQYLKQLPYVHGDKLGCGAHSYSSKLGAYLFTHSQLFSAFAISEGALYANPINIAFSTRGGKSRLGDIERGEEWGNLYENKEAWLEFSTVLQADKPKSPLLLFSNKESSPEYQEAALQIFTALRRLDKKIWWLKYDHGEHTLHDLKELRDHTIRYTQYFDHYLKEAPAPLWMTQGIPINLKGIESRYELDPKGSCGKDCTICKKWNEQYKSHPEMFNQPIQNWHLE